MELLDPAVFELARRGGFGFVFGPLWFVIGVMVLWFLVDLFSGDDRR